MTWATQQSAGAAVARLLLELAADDRQAEQLQAELDALAELLRTDRDFAFLADSPLMGPSTRRAAVERIFAGQVSDCAMGLLAALCEVNGLGLLRVLPEPLRRLRRQRAGVRTAVVTTAQPLDESLRQWLIGRLGEWLSAPVAMSERVDAGLIGGLTVRVDDTVLDGSVRARLEQLRRRLAERGIHEIQSGRNLVAD